MFGIVTSYVFAATNVSPFFYEFQHRINADYDPFLVYRYIDNFYLTINVDFQDICLKCFPDSLILKRTKDNNLAVNYLVLNSTYK